MVVERAQQQIHDLRPIPSARSFRGLTRKLKGRYRECMAYAFIVFDFGTNEEASQQARRRVDGWKQGYRLGNKLLLKFEREVAAAKAAADEAKESAKSKKHGAADKPEKVRVLIRLDFSDHEKLSFRRWLERIPKEEAFKPASSKTIRQGETEFADMEKLFETLD
jgi:hypothetical protein